MAVVRGFPTSRGQQVENQVCFGGDLPLLCRRRLGVCIRQDVHQLVDNAPRRCGDFVLLLRRGLIVDFCQQVKDLVRDVSVLPQWRFCTVSPPTPMPLVLT